MRILLRRSAVCVSFALFVVRFLEMDVSAQGTQLSAPPNQSPAPSSFTSSTASTVVAQVVGGVAGTITLSAGTSVTLDATGGGGQIAALLATGSGAAINATGTAVTNRNLRLIPVGVTDITFGVNATSASGTATITLDGGTITTEATSGGRAYGINVASGGVVDATDVAISTSTMTSASHAVVVAGGTVHLTGGSISTTGGFSLGIQANANSGPTTVTANGTSITTSGNTSSGVTLTGSNDTSVSLTGVTIDTSGSNAPGVTVTGGGSKTLGLADSTITTTSPTSDGILVSGANHADVTISGIHDTIHAGSGNVLTSSGSDVSLTIKNSTLTGDIVGDPQSTVDATLINSTLDGDFDVVNGDFVLEGASDIIVTDNSTFPELDLTGGSSITFNSGPKFTATGEASVLTVERNLTMDRTSSISMGVGGILGKQYDRIQVGGNVTLNGTLNISPLDNFKPAAGNEFAIIESGLDPRTSQTRFGEFTHVNDTLNTNPNLQRVDLYAANGLLLVYVPRIGPPPSPPGPPPPIVDDEPDVILPPVDPDQPFPEEEAIRLLDPTAEELTSLYETSFSTANIQRFSLDDRMAQIQMAGFAAAIPAAATGSLGFAGAAGKEEIGKAPPPPVPQAGPRWGVWANGYGDWVHVSSTSNAQGYHFTTGGMSAGIDYLITPHLAVGLFGGYSHSWVNFRPGSADVDSGRGGLYATYFDPAGWWVNAGVWGGYNSYSTSRQALLGPANGSTDGYEISTFGEAGYDFHCGENLTFGPLVAMQYTDVHVSGFSEHGSLVPLDVHSNSQDSLITDVGGQGSYRLYHGGKISFTPTLKLAWEHEYKYSSLDITGSAPALDGASARFNGPSIGHDSLVIQAGAILQCTPQISISIDYDGQLARDHYISNAVTGVFSYSF